MQFINSETLEFKTNEVFNYITKHKKDIQFNTFADLMLSLSDVKTCNSFNELPALLLELYSKFEAIPHNLDIYRYIAGLLESLGFLNGNCLEVSAGLYPRIAELILPTLLQNQKNLTLYDPELLPLKLPNTTIIKNEFTSNTNIEQTDTLYGLFPCNATIPTIDKAINENKNLLLAFCGCDHSTTEHQNWIGEFWAVDVCMDYREKYGKEIEIQKWPDRYGYPYPIMIRKRQK